MSNWEKRGSAAGVSTNLVKQKKKGGGSREWYDSHLHSHDVTSFSYKMCTGFYNT